MVKLLLKFMLSVIHPFMQYAINKKKKGLVNLKIPRNKISPEIAAVCFQPQDTWMASISSH